MTGVWGMTTLPVCDQARVACVIAGTVTRCCFSNIWELSVRSYTPFGRVRTLYAMMEDQPCICLVTVVNPFRQDV